MPDVNYIGGDNSIASTGNYATTTSAVPKVLRLLTCEYREIDGLPFGNRGWSAGRGATTTAEEREVFTRHCYAALLPLVNAGLIADLVITVVLAAKGTVGVQVEFRDVPAGISETISIAPWGA
jgi:hypothetical protein